jgi:hypothetical protein
MKRTSRKKSTHSDKLPAIAAGYVDVLAGGVDLLESARRTSARAVNAIMTAAYWEIGRRVFEWEQGRYERAEYGQAVVVRLADDLTKRFGRGFGKSNLYQMRNFCQAYQDIFQTLSGKTDPVMTRENADTKSQTPSEKLVDKRPQAVVDPSQIAQTMPDKVLAAEYRMTLPDEKTLAAELERTQAALERRTPPEKSAIKRKRGRT